MQRLVLQVTQQQACNKGCLGDRQVGCKQMPRRLHRHCTHRVYQLGVACGWWWGLLQKVAARLLLQQRWHEELAANR